ncbi:NADPH-dependent FMN reductase [Luteibaculum oceani]|uniref:NAD(P)H-dependent oxidoreductase n=1 Tax=Luteibaculum oceani TaxID=1294296 RepID=A0A5C6UUX0_9FLAO|nr:NADPH-dependent FMN reductase [Luteibaculum oceani]TXC77067.1 NAD(P)H-dependent oxidoreductase [Luteibaculum oceani]
MISIISGTNRPLSNSMIVANTYKNLLEQQGEDAQVLNLEELPSEFMYSASYGKKDNRFEAIVQQFVTGASKFIFVVPEYNGSFPGVLKSFLDCISPKLWHDKKSAIIGLSAGRAGNLRGMDHLTGILHYLQVEVYSKKPKLSQFDKLADLEKRTITDEETLALIEKHISKFLKF